MNLLDRYKRLTFWSKLGVWGSVASLAGIAIYALTPSNGRPTGDVVTSYNQQGGVTAHTINLNAERCLSQAQRIAIIEELRRTSPAEIVITAYLSADDGHSYGAQIGEAILAGGWKVRGNAVNRAVATVADGIQGLGILVRDAQLPPQPARDLRKALSKAMLPVKISSDPGLSADETVLWVGRR